MDSTNIVSYYAQLVGALSGREALLHALSNIDVPLVFNYSRLGRNSTTIQMLQQVLCGRKSSGMVYMLCLHLPKVRFANHFSHQVTVIVRLP
jgi:hypothetical protein